MEKKEGSGGYNLRPRCRVPKAEKRAKSRRKTEDQVTGETPMSYLLGPVRTKKEEEEDLRGCQNQNRRVSRWGFRYLNQCRTQQGLAEYKLVRPVTHRSWFNKNGIFYHVINFEARVKNARNAVVELFFAEIASDARDYHVTYFENLGPAGSDPAGIVGNCRFCRESVIFCSTLHPKNGGFMGFIDNAQ